MIYSYKCHIIDSSLPQGNYAQTAIADFDNDGFLEYVVGLQYGDIFLYKYRSPEDWDRYLLGKQSPSDVGAVALDVDGDGWIDLVVGGAWYKNPRTIGALWEKFNFDANLRGIHDVYSADIDGDGKLEVVTMSDQNDLRWYKIPDNNPCIPWPMTHIGPPVHSGVALGDLSGKGSIDVVRSTVWFENVRGDGTAWLEHPLPFPQQTPELLTEPFMVNATHAVVCDVDRDGDNDIVMLHNEMPGGKVFWFENVRGDGSEWVIHDIFCPETKPMRGAYHSLCCGDFDGDGDIDVFTCEMEAIPGEESPRYYIFENLDGKGCEWKEHVILDANLGGHATVVGSVRGNGLPDIISKPWSPSPRNAVDGKPFVLYLENIGSTNE